MGDPVDASHGQGQQFGGGNTQHNYYGGRREMSWPYQAGVVPALADRRQRRPADDALAAATAGGTVVVCQILAGLGGVGKTQLAANLAHQLRRDGKIDLLMWVTATARADVLTSYAQVAADVTGIEDPDPTQGAARLLAWLAGTPKRWLIVLDDLADPADMRGLWPPDTATGRTVVTTRRRDAALLDRRRLIDVELFTPEEALAYLHGKLGGAAHRLDEAAELAADLGWLPLALAQAAAYLQDQDLTCAEYRERLARRRLAKLRPDLLPDDQAKPVAETWALSVDLADAATGGVAGGVLQIAALLDPNGIPLAVFTTKAVTGYCGARLGRSVDADDARDAILALHRLGLADHNPGAGGPDGATVRIHALVQRATRETTPEEHQRPLALAAAGALLELWPEIERDNTHAGPLRANTASLHTTTGALLWGEHGGHLVLFRTGQSLGETGLVGAAADYFRALHATAGRHLAADHPQILSTRSTLAYWRGEAGDVAGVPAEFEQLLADSLRIVGPDHHTTLSIRHNVASWRGRSGDATGAVTEFERLLLDYIRVLGPEHSETLNTRHNVAYWRGEAGDALGAVAEFERLRADQVRVLGPSHPRTLSTRHNVAYWRAKAGDTAGALAEFELLLADRLQVLGPDHPRTLGTRHNVAFWRGEEGDAAGAVAEFERLVADSLRVLGPDHPDTVKTRGNLDYWRGRAAEERGRAAEERGPAAEERGPAAEERGRAAGKPGRAAEEERGGRR